MHVEITSERRTRIAERYERQLNDMLAKLEGWYPDKRLTPELLKSEHGNFRDRLASLANDLGYGSYCELLRFEGFDIALDKRAAAHPVTERIAVADAIDEIISTVTDKLDGYIAKVDEWYPDGDVASFARDHPTTKDNLNVQAKNLGFESWVELLNQLGYKTPSGYNPKGGRKASVDPEAIVAELEARYKGKEPASSMDALRDDNPDLAPRFKTLANTSKAVFGMTFAKLLKSRGILSGARPKAEGAISIEEANDLLDKLEEQYANAPKKPRNASDLEKNWEPGLAVALGRVSRACQALYGKTYGQVLYERGIVLRKGGGASRPNMGNDEVEELFEGLKSKYSHSIRPRTLKEFEEANPDYSSCKAAIKKYIGDLGFSSPSEYLVSEGLLSKVASPDSLPRPTDDIVLDFQAEISTELAELERMSPSANLVQFDCEVTTASRGAPEAYEMLRIGDSVKLSRLGESEVSVIFCNRLLGTIQGWSPAMKGLALKVAHAEDLGLVGGLRVRTGKRRRWHAEESQGDSACLLCRRSEKPA